jgi:hypothetical protein
MTNRKIPLLLAVLGGFAAVNAALAQLANSIATTGETEIARARAEGAQIYECKAASDGALSWQFREPIATLMMDGKTVGRHYAGPNWELMDGSAVSAKPIGNVAGRTPADIPWLKLEVTGRRGVGTLTDATTVLRINTQGGVLTGPCDRPGSFRAVPYAADYVFLRRDA